MQIAPDEKSAMVMVYTQNMLVRGEVVVKEGVRVSIWLRTQGVPNYIHIHKPQVIMFGGGSPKPISYAEIFVPTAMVIAFHLVPPAQEGIDYDEKELNRIMQPMNVIVGTFLLKAHLRISSQAEVSTSLEVSRAAWLSVYDAAISNPNLPQFGLQVPMLLVNPSQVSFGMV